MANKKGISTKITLAIRGRTPLINPPHQKKGISTKIVLAIGIVVMAAIVLIAGARFIAPFFVGTAAHATEELALSIDALYAAPEDARYKIDLPSQIEDECLVKLYEKKVEVDCTPEGFSPKYEERFTAVKKTISHSGCSVIEITDADCIYRRPSSLTLKKNYNENTGKNKELEIKE